VRPRLTFRLLVLGLVLGASGAHAAAKDAKDAVPYGQNLISVVTHRHTDFPTGSCDVWANAEGLGVGPAQLGGYHGLTMSIDLKPMAKDSPEPVTFAKGLAAMKARFPTAPDWLVQTLQKNQAAIEAACAQDHDTPYVVHKIAAADKKAG
jgi:hypothetical protein